MRTEIVAQSQGQIAPKNMLSAQQPFDVGPFFWSQHNDQTISYVGHAASWNRLEISGDPITGSCVLLIIIMIKN